MLRTFDRQPHRPMAAQGAAHRSSQIGRRRIYLLFICQYDNMTLPEGQGAEAMIASSVGDAAPGVRERPKTTTECHYISPGMATGPDSRPVDAFSLG